MELMLGRLTIDHFTLDTLSVDYTTEACPCFCSLTIRMSGIDIRLNPPGEYRKVI